MEPRAHQMTEASVHGKENNRTAKHTLSAAIDDRHHRPDRSVVTDQSQLVRCGGLNWNVHTSGSGPRCLLIHGTGASVHTWKNLVPLLAPHLTLTMIDLPGHAGTQTPPHTDLSLPAVAGMLFEFLQQQDHKPELIVGHSAGAAVMLQMCVEHEQTNIPLVSINGAVMPLGGIAGYLFSPLARMSSTNGWMSHFFALRARNKRNVHKVLDSTGSVVDENSFATYSRLFQDPAHVAGVLRMMANWRLEPLTPHLYNLNNEIKLIAADNDKTIALRDTYRLHQLLPHSSVSIVKNKGHLVHEEDPQSIARIILEFVKQRQPGESKHANH
jgi:magnesium chelatase accessory protein